MSLLAGACFLGNPVGMRQVGHSNKSYAWLYIRAGEFLEIDYEKIPVFVFLLISFLGLGITPVCKNPVAA